MTTNQKLIYNNHKQLAFLQGTQRFKTFVGGIGSGKTFVMGEEAYLDVLALPGGSQFFLGNTYKHVLTNTLPAIIKAWDKFGLIEDVHYRIGKKPFEHWDKAYEPPKNYDNVISFPNGHNIQILSLDRPELIRGSSFQCGKVDEAGLIPEKLFKSIVLGRLRGEKALFPSHRFRSISFFTSMPFLSFGTWVLDYERKAQLKPNKYFYIESTTYDNVDILGQDYIDDLEEDMDPLIFAREVKNERGLRLPNAFYSEFNDERHTYSRYEYTQTDNWQTTRFIDADTSSTKEFHVSIDFGGQANFMTVWQDFIKEARELRCVNEFWRKKPQILDDMIDKFMDYYKDHDNKFVYLWGDKTGAKAEENSRRTLYEQVADRMKKRGWKVTIKYDGWDNPKHQLKHFVLNQLLKEESDKLPKIRINLARCKATIISIKNAAILENHKKDKRSEHDGVTDREYATDLSDTVDYFLYFKLSRLVERRRKRISASAA